MNSNCYVKIRIWELVFNCDDTRIYTPTHPCTDVEFTPTLRGAVRRV